MSGLPFFILETPDRSQVPLTDPTTFGRGTDNTVVLHDVSVSSHHAVIRKDGAFWIVEDLGSTNGTWLNHNRVDGWAVIKEGDQIQMGSQMIRLSGFRSSGDRRASAEAPTCPRCAKQLPGDAVFCPACGIPLGKYPVPPPTGADEGMGIPDTLTAPFVIPYPSGTPPHRKANLMVGCIILTVILLLLSLLAGWWVWDGFLKNKIRESGTKSGRVMADRS